MSKKQFDPYHKWLGIPPAAQPPTHYRILGIDTFEVDPDVIECSAQRQIAHVRSYAVGSRVDISQEILNELATARCVLLDPAAKLQYDGELRRQMKSEGGLRIEVKPRGSSGGPSWLGGGISTPWMLCICLILILVGFAVSLNLGGTKAVQSTKTDVAPIAGSKSEATEAWGTDWPLLEHAAEEEQAFVFPSELQGGVVEDHELHVEMLDSFMPKSPFNPEEAKEQEKQADAELVDPLMHADQQVLQPNFLGMKFVQIPSGAFTRGKVGDGRHSVRLTRGFELGAYEVTNSEYETVMETDLSIDEFQDCPATVSWYEAKAFCKALSEKDEAASYRLPTEAEWEYSSKAGRPTIYCFGDQTFVLREYGWYRTTSGGRTHKVGLLRPNKWGLFDMHGNVSEWCQDWAGVYPANAVVNPVGPATGEMKIARGGAYDSTAGYCISTMRLMYDPRGRSLNLGFRVIRE